MMHDFCFEIKIFQVRKEYVENLSHYFSNARSYLLYESFQSPGEVAYKIEGKGEYRTQYRS